jgi:hypothetical protein
MLVGDERLGETFSAKTHGDGLVYFADHLSVAATGTNVDNDQFATSRERFINKDLKVTDNGDGTLTVLLISTGNATIYDASGRAIGRNPGQTRTEFLVDHGGTPEDPADDVLISEEVVKDSTGRSDDFCEVVVPALT